MLEPFEGTQGRNGVVSNVVEVFGLTFKGLPVPTALPKLHLEGTELEMSQAVGAHTCQANSEICGGNLVVYRGTGIVATLSHQLESAKLAAAEGEALQVLDACGENLNVVEQQGTVCQAQSLELGDDVVGVVEEIFAYTSYSVNFECGKISAAVEDHVRVPEIKLADLVVAVAMVNEAERLDGTVLGAAVPVHGPDKATMLDEGKLHVQLEMFQFSGTVENLRKPVESNGLPSGSFPNLADLAACNVQIGGQVSFKVLDGGG